MHVVESLTDPVVLRAECGTFPVLGLRTTELAFEPQTFVKNTGLREESD